MAEQYVELTHTAAEVDSAVTSIVSHVANTTIHVTAADKQNWNAKPNSTDFAAVAFSGSYADLLNTPTIDSSLSDSSTNAVQNKVVKAALDLKANTADLASVAFSGSYSDLSGTPTVDDTLNPNSTNALQNAAVASALTALLNNILGSGTTLTPTSASKLDLDNINLFDPSLPSFGRITVGASAAANVLNLPAIGATYGFVLERSAIFGTAGRECQTLRFNATQEAGNIYERCKYSNGWGSWYRYQGTAVT